MALLTLMAAALTSAYAFDSPSCQGEACDATHNTQGMSLLMTHTRLSKTDLAAIQAGHEKCPCLTAEDLDDKGGYFPEKIYEKEKEGKWYKVLPECNDPSTEWFFPKDLGIGKCDSMDKLAPFCGSGGPDSPKRWKTDWMCQQKFCHVDPDKCPHDWVVSGNLFPGLAFSYRTCLPDDASDAEKERTASITGVLQQDHRAYHCAAEIVDDDLQSDADKIGRK